MANLISAQTGLWTDASTWQTVDTTSELDSEAATTNISTSVLDSAAFTPGAITVDGIALKHAARAASPSGSFTVTLRNSSAGTDITSVTINVVDLPASTLGWIFYKFSAPQTLLAATNYVVRVVCSNTGNQVTLYRNATANNWSRKLRTTTTQVPAANDHIVIVGQQTGAGALTAVDVTYDSTSTTSYGPTVSGGPPQGMCISLGGTLSLQNTAADYFLKVKGILHISNLGLFEWGTTGSRINSASTAVLEFESIANNDSRVVVTHNGTFRYHGPTKTTKTTLTATASAGATSIAVAEATNWEVNDEICFTPSSASQVNNQYEKKTASSVSGLTIGIAALTNTHLVSSQFDCYVGNLTRRAKFKSTSASFGTSISNAFSGVIDISYVEFVNTTGNAFTAAGTVANTFSVDNCSVQNFPNLNYVLLISTSAIDCNFSNNVVYASVGNQWVYHDNYSSTGLKTVSGNYFIGHTANTNAYQVNTCNGSERIYGNVFSGKTSATGIGIDIIIRSQVVIEPNFFDDNIVTHFQCALQFSADSSTTSRGLSGTIKNLKLRLIGNSFQQRALNIAPPSNPINLNPLIFDGLEIVGTGTNSLGLLFQNASGVAKVINGVFAGTTGNQQRYGITISNDCRYLELELQNCNFGVVVGDHTAHSVQDIIFSNTNRGLAKVTAMNCNLASSTTFTGLQGGTTTSILSSFRNQGWQGDPADHRSYFYHGTVQTDSVIFRTSAPSERLTPLSATTKLESGLRMATVDDTATKTISVYVRKSEAGDGVAYNGNQPRLILKQYFPTGVTVDTVLATMTAAAGTWEQLTAVTPAATADGVFKFLVDCDGTAGWINVDDITVT